MKFIATSKYLVDIKFLMYVHCFGEELSFHFSEQFKREQDEEFFIWSKNEKAVKKVYDQFIYFLNKPENEVFNLDHYIEVFNVYEKTD